MKFPLFFLIHKSELKQDVCVGRSFCKAMPTTTSTKYKHKVQVQSTSSGSKAKRAHTLINIVLEAIDLINEHGTGNGSIHALLGRLHLGQVGLERLHEVLEVAPRHLGEVLELLLVAAVPLGDLG